MNSKLKSIIEIDNSLNLFDCPRLRSTHFSLQQFNSDYLWIAAFTHFQSLNVFNDLSLFTGLHLPLFTSLGFHFAADLSTHVLSLLAQNYHYVYPYNHTLLELLVLTRQFGTFTLDMFHVQNSRTMHALLTEIDEISESGDGVYYHRYVEHDLNLIALREMFGAE